MHQSIHEEIPVSEALEVNFRIYEDSNHLVPNHWHDSLEVVYLYQGTMKVTIADKAYLLNQGDFILINSADIHSTFCEAYVKVLLLQIPQTFLKQAISGFEQSRFCNFYQQSDALNTHASPQFQEIHSKITQLLLCMGEAFYQKQPWYSLHFKSLLYELLFLLMKYFRQEINPVLQVKTAKNLKRLEGILNYVRDHYQESVSLTEIAEFAGLTPEYFCRFFKKYMGQTFQEYLNTVRLTHVYEDLAETDLSLTTILGSHGFTNYKLFMRMFRNTYHCTPSQMRKILSGKDKGD
ncbi:AraC family transcriptional regulator [Candidatus Acetatifactor stercoripullorum]|uniref:AraC family transcriptional regulator n=1 Tax=Candidatus Acetatifactor stercoripullorum TaxID=2838414 RepID=UPI00298E5509|nr:AraC family transcriptional regulator [Candidatus Acetatifactor stercoripullorum]